MKKLLIASLSAVIAVSSTSAIAAEEIEVAISHEGLDLRNSDDVSEMHSRIEAAATAACAKAGRISLREACVRDATEKAVAQLEERSRLATAYTNAGR